MKKSNITVVVLGLVAAAGLIFLAGYYTPKPINWYPSYNTKDKIPLGLYVFDKEIDSIFHYNYVTKVKESIIDYFYDGYFDDALDEDGNLDYQINFLYIHPEIKWNQHEVDQICHLVRQGNTALLSSIDFPNSMLDSLKVMINPVYFNPIFRHKADTLVLSLDQKIKPNTNIVDHKGISGSWFTKYDLNQSQILGYVKSKEGLKPNFLKVRYGNGHFLLHLDPAVFTNYFLLKNDFHQYAAGVLSQLPAHHDIIWSLNNQTSKVVSDSPLRFILSQPALKWAWYLLLAGILAFIIFNLRRTQRSIPIIPKNQNTSVEFVKTIGNLYYQEGDIRNLIDKKIIYWLEKIRGEFHIDTSVINEHFIHQLAQKSGKDEQLISQIFFLIRKHQEHDYACTIDDLRRLNTAIENFYK
jgi:hypothetical protein